ncbi:TPA: phosphopyruvate hydratase [Candidatus Avigastranaerophilus faecigallinarum]|nr:phosphopyruvate hydratase [Candidatus Avigastranaerophilus faecigallinarum]
MKSKIKDIKARQIIDSRGTPTIETEIILESGHTGRASVPSGASTGKFEAIELRDNNEKEYNGKSIHKAILNIENYIKPQIIGLNVFNQREIDVLMCKSDGTENKSKYGANAILSVSFAIARAAANELKLPLYKYIGGIYGNKLPFPMMNIINGGRHANNKLDFQEFMIQPICSKNIKESIKICAEIYYKLKEIIDKQGFSTSVGDEGGFAPNIKTNKEALDLIIQSINDAHYTTNEVKICLDIAASEFYKNGKYYLEGEGKELTSEEMIKYISELVKDYPIHSIEDGLNEEDYTAWKKLTKELGEKCQLVGDDLFVTNYNKLEAGIKEKIANAILIKPNQTGTLTETLDTIQLAKQNNYNTIISHRSGETEDTFIADLAVGVNAGQIKAGSIARSERTSKYNQLIRIEEELENIN